MQKKHVVRLNDEERHELQVVIKKLSGTSQKVRRAQILLKADADGPGWTDARIAEAFGCRTKTVENIRQRLIENEFRETLDGKRRLKPPTGKLLDGEQEAKTIATRLGPPPKGYANWSLRLLARKVVELEIVDTVSSATLCRMLKKTARQAVRCSTGPYQLERRAAGGGRRVRRPHGRRPGNLCKTVSSWSSRAVHG